MRSVLLILFALFLGAVQAALLRWVGGGLFSLALPLIVVAHLGLTADHVEGAVAAAGVGYVMDLMAGGPKGLMTFLAVALFLFTRIAGSALDVHGRVGFAFLTALGVFVYGAAALGLADLVTAPLAAPAPTLLRRIGVEALATGLASPFVLVGLRRIDGLFTREEPGLLQ